jgi:hypothetical protein
MTLFLMVRSSFRCLTACASAAGRAAAAADQVQRYRAAAEALTPRQQQALVRLHMGNHRRFRNRRSPHRTAIPANLGLELAGAIASTAVVSTADFAFA